MKLYLKTITPLHIGNGEELYSLDYVINNNEFFHVSQNLFLQFLKENDLDIKNYSNWIVKNTKEIDALDSEKKQNRRNFDKDKNQQLSFLRREFNLKNYTKAINKFDDFIFFLKKHTYSIKFKNNPKQQIRGIIKNAENFIYIPGSSIKGAIRTALLFDYMNEHENSDNVVNSFISELNKLKQNPRDKNKIVKNFASKLEQNAFYCGVENKEKIIYSDEKFDLFKLLSVSDGNLISDDALTLENLDLYLISKNKDTGKRCADKQLQAPTIEAVKENTFIEFEIDFNIDLLLNIKQHLKDDKIITKIGKDKFQKQWIGIETKLKNIFNIDIRNITRENKDEIKKQVINTIFNKVFDFSEFQKEWDKNWVENFNDNDFGNQYSKKINNGFEKVRNSNNLFHLGFGSGFTGITEFLYLMENKDIKAKFKDVMEAFGIGNRPGNKGKFTANPDNFPKSKRLISRNDSIIPIGWTEIIYKESDIKEFQKEITRRKKEQQQKLQAEQEEKQAKIKAEQEEKQRAEDERLAKIEAEQKAEQERLAEENRKKQEFEAEQKRNEEQLKKRQEHNKNKKEAEKQKLIKLGLAKQLAEISDFNTGKDIIANYKNKVGKIPETEYDAIKQFLIRIYPITPGGKNKWKKFKKSPWGLIKSWLGKPTAQKWFDEIQKQ